MTSLRPKLGAHVSASGGLFKAVERALDIGAECIQIFGASPQQWHAKQPSSAEISQFKEALSESKHEDGGKVGPVFLHAAYLVNLASENPDSRKKSIQSLADHLSIAEKISAEGLIFHMGSCKDKEVGIARTAEGIHAVLAKVPGNAKLIMENSAGGGNKLGTTVEEMGQLFQAAQSLEKTSRLKICIDTAHSFESGAIEEYTTENIRTFVDAWDAAVGVENIAALHVNDSKTAAHSHHDRHENLGEGHIGLNGFQALAKEKRLHHASWMLEVPGFDGNGPDKKNLDILKGCF